MGPIRSTRKENRMTRIQNVVVAVAAGAVLTAPLDAQWPTPSPAPPALPEVWDIPPMALVPELAFELPEFPLDRKSVV